MPIDLDAHLMRWVASLLACALLALGVLACGGASGDSEKHAPEGSLPAAALPEIEVKKDADGDSDRYPAQRRSDRDEVPSYRTEPFGHPADRADARALVALVRRYYADAAHGSSLDACRLLYGPRSEATAGEDDARTPNQRPSLAACARYLSRLFTENPGLLRAQEATLRVGAIRDEYNKASVQLYFGHPAAAYYIEAHRERGLWKLEMVLAVNRPVDVE